MSTADAPPATPRDPKAAFSDWLQRKMDASVSILEWETPEGVGHSNETILVRAKAAERDLRLVVRVQAAPPAVFPSYDLALQCECVRRVAAHSAVPVPNVRWHDPAPDVFGRPFFVMDRIDGLVPTDRMPYTLSGWLFEASPEEQAALYQASLDTLGAIHRVDWRAAGLDLLDRDEHGAIGLGQQLRWWKAFADWVCGGRPQATIDPATAWLDAHVPDPKGPNVLNWGDARLSNLMFRDFRPVAVFDWEMASLGPAELDLAWFLYFQRFFSEGIGVPDLPGFLPREAAIRYYERIANRKMDDLFFYEVFAAWRNSLILLRIADIYESRGYLSPESAAGQNNVATRMLASMLGLPSPGEPGGPFG